MTDTHVAAPSLEKLLTHHSEKWRGFDRDVLPLPVAEMDFPIAESIKQTLLNMVSTSDLGYLGLVPELPSGFAHFASHRWGWDIDTNQVRIAADVGVAVVEVLRVFTKPGDSILINSPVYQNFYNWINETHLNLVDVPFTRTGEQGDFENPWELDWDAVEKAYSSGLRVHLMCSPHNPLGRMYSKEELTRVAEMAKKYGVLVISDEIHAPLTFKEKTFIPFLSLDETAREVGITVTAASKGWNIAGLKCAIIVSQNDAINKKLEELPKAVHFRASILGAFASASAFADGGTWLDTVIAQLDHNRFMIKDLLAAKLPTVGYHIPHNSYLAWLDLESLNLGENPSLTLLERGRVAFNPGHTYGAQCSQYVRLNFATSPEIISEAIDRIVRTL
ncbi:MAG: aminotransferase class I/II-fold pyridoxal phosphate-dependent enzyme [Actinobacteria bacterium]|uniref:cysteine-S-conjugate beta-lyase n=1 Tax=freshwater metagenome TaxID=449393 RepID=A0A6J7AYL2_9ZZZZ|nr:aminotransferase class I/II-fold pyridoxal phosphate-dependent enzyme [Actinomycetota bacterium]MSY35276.1 aminotransferase class I/II-fold pyridoxal phosphate-dependent enzyme [Actinomycetota bacterium]MTB28838.1 aminotransferase class I/II-fold pyridoxal phosphate-dependent enzyme [Actinomycetota bacterium]MUH48403.1 aminotransferase class I/II-fold pyridoxal phosphate-dependent enzyme [Actinomycetota bacterium]